MACTFEKFDPSKGLVPGVSPEKVDWCTFLQLINNILSFVVAYLIWPIAGGMIAYAAFLFITSAGNEGKIKSAKAALRNVVIGIIIVISAYVVITSIISYLGLPKGASPF